MITYLNNLRMELYDRLLSDAQKRPDYAAGTPPSQEIWPHYVGRANNLDLVKAEALYAVIIHYNYITYKVIEPLPYGIRRLSAAGGVVLPCLSLPPILQYIIITFLEKY
jgi:hypothetical protein